jgi:hypothetical protein
MVDGFDMTFLLMLLWFAGMFAILAGQLSRICPHQDAARLVGGFGKVLSGLCQTAVDVRPGLRIRAADFRLSAFCHALPPPSVTIPTRCREFRRFH